MSVWYDNRWVPRALLCHVPESRSMGDMVIHRSLSVVVGGTLCIYTPPHAVGQSTGLWVSFPTHTSCMGKHWSLSFFPILYCIVWI